MICKVKSDGLGGYAGISNTICHGSPKKITLCKLLLLLLYMCVTITQSSFNVNCISLILDLQRSNERDLLQGVQTNTVQENETLLKNVQNLS